MGTRGRFALVAFTGQLAFAAVAFLGSVVTARLLGPSAKGELTAWTLGTTTGALALAGPIPVGLGRGYLRGDRAGVVRAATLHGFLATVVVIVISGGLIALEVDAVPVLFCVLLAIPCTLVVQDLLVTLQAAKRAWLFQVIRLVSAAVFSLGALLLLLLRPSVRLDAAYALWGIAALLSLVVAIVIGIASLGRGRARSLREFASLGRGSYLAGLLDWLTVRVHQYFVLLIAGSYSLGIYSVAVNWAEVVQYAGYSMGQALFEEERTLDSTAVRRILARSAVILIVFSACVGIAGVLLVEVLFGQPFAAAKWPLLLFMPGTVARSLAYAGGQILLARGQGPRLSRISIVVLAFGALTWTVMTATLGVEGTAAATTLTYGLQFWLTWRALSVRLSPPSASHTSGEQ